jgi:superoxide reductase
MDRRQFIRLGLVGVGSSIVAPKIVLGGVAKQQMAGGVYHTAGAPGRWDKKVSSHLPNIEVQKQGDGAIVKVLTRHTMEKYEHYIVKHMLLDKDFQFVEEKMFDPLNDKEPASEFVLENYSGAIHVLSVCNIHDTWMNVAEV